MAGKRTRRRFCLLLLAGAMLATATACREVNSLMREFGIGPSPTPLSLPRPRPTREPTAGPTPDISDCALGALFLEDVTIPDNTQIDAGQPFTKTWRIRNTGTCDWGAGYHLAFLEGDQMEGPDFAALAETPSGESTEVSVSLVGPAEQGAHRGYWQICANEDRCFGDKVYVQVVSTGEPAPRPETSPSSATCTAEEVAAYFDEASRTMDQIFDLLALTETASRENMASVADEVEELQAELRERPYPACLSESRRLADEAIDQLVLALEAFAADEPNWKELMDEGQVMLVKVRWENERVLEEEVTP